LPNYILNCIWFILYQCFEWCEKTAKTNDERLLTQLQTTGRRNISGFRAGKRKISAQGSQIEMDSHADTIVCGSNCLIMYYTGKECDVLPYTEAYEAIKSVPIVQAATAYHNRDTGENYYFDPERSHLDGRPDEAYTHQPQPTTSLRNHRTGQPVRPSTNLYLN
jgi:hypothetical protein